MDMMWGSMAVSSSPSSSSCLEIQNGLTLVVWISVADPDPHQSDKLDPDPHQSDKQDPDPHQSERFDSDTDS
jgi:hypothetical protein